MQSDLRRFVQEKMHGQAVELVGRLPCWSCWKWPPADRFQFFLTHAAEFGNILVTSLGWDAHGGKFGRLRQQFLRDGALHTLCIHRNTRLHMGIEVQDTRHAKPAGTQPPLLATCS